jgi:hypothetical protein
VGKNKSSGPKTSNTYASRRTRFLEFLELWNSGTLETRNNRNTETPPMYSPVPDCPYFVSGNPLRIISHISKTPRSNLEKPGSGKGHDRMSCRPIRSVSLVWSENLTSVRSGEEGERRERIGVVDLISSSLLRAPIPTRLHSANTGLSLAASQTEAKGVTLALAPLFAMMALYPRNLVVRSFCVDVQLL